MHKYTFEKILGIIITEVTQVAFHEANIENLAYDSRKLPNPSVTLFFALSGLQDGHRYVQSAYDQGVRNFVLDFAKRTQTPSLKDANIAWVESPIAALQAIAKYHRKQFHYTVIGITGSNGKTIVKDWLNQLLSPDFSIVKTPKSYNSQIGVPISLWQMNDTHTLALIEAGISQVGEMSRLADMIQPTISVLTNIGAAHQEGFRDEQEKLAEKMILGTNSEVFITPLPLPTHVIDKIKRCTTIYVESGKVPITIPFIDRASIENAVTCWRVMKVLGYTLADVTDRFTHLHQMDMRLQLKEGINRTSLIDDSYSNDLSSLEISLDFLLRQDQHPIRTLIWSDLPEVKGFEQAAYASVSQLFEKYPIDQLITVGPRLLAKKESFPIKKWLAFPDTDSLIAALPSLQIQDQSVLIKGARKFNFERITRALAAQSHETRLELHMDHLRNNVAEFKQFIGPNVKLMAMVKAFSYGSGSFEVANLLQFHKVDYLAVAYADEGVALRKGGIQLPIMVMDPDVNSFSALYDYQLSPEIFSFQILQEWSDFLCAKNYKGAWPIHIKLDTGMHRLGFQKEELDQLGKALQLHKNLLVESVFSHLVASGDPNFDEVTRTQLHEFLSGCDLLSAKLNTTFIRHIANTDGIIRFPEAHLDMVRLGIGMHGVEHKKGINLRQVPVLKTTITQIHEINAGERIGYGLKGQVSRDSRIATVRIGYADGYDRRFGNGVGQMQLHGKYVPCIGDICMDLCMLDITDVPEAAVGDEVIVYGDIQGLAQKIGTIPYELLVRISQRVKRIYYYGW
jgi:alanine racemase